MQRETQKEADDFLHYYATEHGDDEATDNILRTLGVETGIFSPEEQQRFKFHFKAGWGVIRWSGRRSTSSTRSRRYRISGWTAFR